jgi:hypothetical protein
MSPLAKNTREPDAVGDIATMEATSMDTSPQGCTGRDLQTEVRRMILERDRRWVEQVLWTSIM